MSLIIVPDLKISFTSYLWAALFNQKPALLYHENKRQMANVLPGDHLALVFSYQLLNFGVSSSGLRISRSALAALACT